MREGIAEYLPVVYRFALRLTGDRHLAEDLAQEAMLRIWKTQSELREERAVRVWLFQITSNLWKDGLRRDSSRDSGTSLAVNNGQEFPLRTVSAEQQLEIREELTQALEWLDGLPDRQRSVLYLVAVEQLSLTEVSEILGIDQGAVRASLSLARRRMRGERSRWE